MALSINDVIGSGVYLILPVAAAALLGPASVWAILAAGFAVLLLVLCFAEAGSLFDKPGGAIVYTRAAFGEFVGFEVGWMTWIARIASEASLSVFFARAVGYLWDGANHGLGQARDDRRASRDADLDQRARREVRSADRGRSGLRKDRAAARPRRGRHLRGGLEPRVPGAAAARAATS